MIDGRVLVYPNEGRLVSMQSGARVALSHAYHARMYLPESYQRFRCNEWLFIQSEINVGMALNPQVTIGWLSVGPMARSPLPHRG